MTSSGDADDRVRNPPLPSLETLNLPRLPEPGHVELWAAHVPAELDATLAAEYLAICNDAERAQHARYRRERDRRRYLVTRALVRTTLAGYLGAAPQAVRFVHNAHERPELEARPRLEGHARGRHPLRFNLSHTDHHVLLAIARDHDVGVDIEDRRRRCDMLTIARHFFSADERAALERFEDAEARRHHFFALWTLKEAYIKARGKGLAIPLDRVSFDLGGPHVVVSLDDDTDHELQPPAWQFVRFEAFDEHSSALVLGADFTDADIADDVHADAAGTLAGPAAPRLSGRCVVPLRPAASTPLALEIVQRGLILRR